MAFHFCSATSHSSTRETFPLHPNLSEFDTQFKALQVNPPSVDTMEGFEQYQDVHTRLKRLLARTNFTLLHEIEEIRSYAIQNLTVDTQAQQLEMNASVHDTNLIKCEERRTALKVFHAKMKLKALPSPMQTTLFQNTLTQLGHTDTYAPDSSSSVSSREDASSLPDPKAMTRLAEYTLQELKRVGVSEKTCQMVLQRLTPTPNQLVPYSNKEFTRLLRSLHYLNGFQTPRASSSASSSSDSPSTERKCPMSLRRQHAKRQGTSSASSSDQKTTMRIEPNPFLHPFQDNFQRQKQAMLSEATSQMLAKHCSDPAPNPPS